MVAPRTSPLVTAGLAAAGAIPASVGFSSSGSYVLSNGKVTAVALEGVLTVALKTLAGNDPSARDRVLCAFRDPASASGAVIVREITSALSLDVATELGTEPDEPFRIWVALFDNDGDIHLAVRNCFSASLVDIFAFNEEDVADAADIDGSGHVGNTFFSDIEITAKAFRAVAYLDFNEGLPSPWSTGPDQIQPLGIGSKKPGDICREQSFIVTASSTATATIPFDDTVPQISEGTVVVIAGFGPSSPINVLEFEFIIPCSYSVAGVVIASVFRSGENLGSTWGYVPSADAPITLTLRARRQSVSDGDSYQLVLGGATAGTLTINGSGGSRKLGGSAGLHAKMREYMV